MQRASRLFSSHILAAIFITVVIAMSAALAIYTISSRGQNGNEIQGGFAVPQSLRSFQNYAELQAYVAANARSIEEYNRYGAGFLFGGTFEASTAMAGAAGPEASLASTPSYTGTNVQVAGVDEPDSVKTDGTHLFVSSGASVTIINAGSASVLSIISLGSDASILGIEISRGRLMVINQRGWQNVDILLYDTSNLFAPKLFDNVSVAGSYVAARLVGGYFYAVIQELSYNFDNSGNATPVMPQLYSNGALTPLPPQSVYYTPNGAQVSEYTMILGVNMSTGQESSIAALTGPSSVVYVSTSSIYVVYSNYREWYADGIPGDVFSGGVMQVNSPAVSENSTILRASYASGVVSVQAAGFVPGTVLNQFSLDEYNGYLRVATSRNIVTSQAGSFNEIRSDDVYVLDQSLSQVSALRNIAPDENIYAVRFVGDMGYVVTFEQVDPLFAISFADLYHPAILSALKVSGFSDYLHPLWNASYILGVGKDAVQASDGSYAYYLGLKLSLFRVFPNGSSEELSNLPIGDRGTDSPVLSDHLAFTFDPANNVTVIPVLLAKLSGNQSSYGDAPPFGNYVWQGVYVIRVSSEGLTILGNVSQYSQNYSPGQNLDIDRSVIIGNHLYTISATEVMVSDLSSFARLAIIPLSG
jgi:inhibitor of cysteine peptidase